MHSNLPLKITNPRSEANSFLSRQPAKPGKTFYYRLKITPQLDNVTAAACSQYSQLLSSYYSLTIA